MPVLTFEEHASVLPAWWSRGFRGRTVIGLDAHLDIQFVDEAKLAPLRNAANEAEVVALGKPHHLLPDTDFSYSIENFLYPAFRLGLIERFIWVAPPHVETGYSEAALDQIRRMEGVTFDDLLAFRRVDGGWLEGRLLGLPVTICSYGHLAAMDLPSDSLIDADIDYFLALPGDAPWIDPRIVYDALSALPLDPELVTVSRSVSSGFMPTRYRFFADYLAALWERRTDDAAHFTRLFDLDVRLRAGQTQAVLSALSDEQADHSNCAATHALLGVAETDSVLAAEHHDRAAALCDAYRPNLLRSVNEIRSRQLPVTANHVRALERRITSEGLDGPQRALVHAGLGLIYCSAGQPTAALEHFAACSEHAVPHPELALELASVALRSDMPAAMSFLDAALDDGATRLTASFLLGYMHAERGEISRARDRLLEVRKMAPAWGDPLDVLSAVYVRAGNEKAARECTRLFAEQQEQIERLKRRIV